MKLDIPADVRQSVMIRAKGHCEDCGERLPLELHHLRYSNTWDKKSIRGRELPDDLAALCRDCHHERHLDPNREFWRDPEEMEEFWAPYWWESDKP